MLIFAPNLTEAMAMKQRLTILLMVTLTLLTFACSHPDEEPTQKSETPTEPVVKPDTTQTTKPDTTQTTKPDTTQTTKPDTTQTTKPDTTQTTPPDTIQTTPRDTTMGIGASLTPWEEDPNDGGGTAK